LNLTIYNYITIGSMVILTILILLQTRGATLGAGMGGGGEVNTVRRGSDRTLHQITIVLAIIFASSLILGIV
jgi:preprotein translocase subunit SecG